jgi:hypothetical protein
VVAVETVDIVVKIERQSLVHTNGSEVPVRPLIDETEDVCKKNVPRDVYHAPVRWCD